MSVTGQDGTKRKPRRVLNVLSVIASLILMCGISFGLGWSMNKPVPQTGVSAPSPRAVPAEPVTSPLEVTPAGTLTNGTYEVGVDIEPGRYKTSGDSDRTPRKCYYARSSTDSGELSDMISSDLFEGASSLTVNEGEFVKFTGGCTWTKQ